jgi:UDP-N-acetylmuramate--alanine ligase
MLLAKPQLTALTRHPWLPDCAIMGIRPLPGLDGPDTLAAEIAARTSQGDVVMCLGAGDITAWAAALPHQLDKLAGESA